MPTRPLPLAREVANIGTPEDEEPAMRPALTLMMVLLFASPLVLAEQFYKWQDDKGVWHYSAQRPKDQQADKLKVRSATPTAMTDDEQTDAAASKKAEPESPNCQAARSNLKILNSSSKVAKDTDGDGEPETLTLEQHQEEISEAERQILAFCKPPAAPKPTEEETE